MIVARPISASGSALAYNGPWEDRPDPSTLPDGALIYASDVALGTYLKSIVGLYWSPCAGSQLLGAALANVTTDTSGDEQMMYQCPINAGLWLPGASMSTFLELSKSGTNNANTLRLRLGTNGDLTDTLIGEYTSNPGSAAQLTRGLLVVRRITPTSVQVSPAIQTSASTAVAWGSDVTVDDMDDNDMILSVTCDLGGTTDTVTLRTCETTYVAI